MGWRAIRLNLSTECFITLHYKQDDIENHMTKACKCRLWVEVPVGDFSFFKRKGWWSQLELGHMEVGFVFIISLCCVKLENSSAEDLPFWSGHIMLKTLLVCVCVGRGTDFSLIAHSSSNQVPHCCPMQLFKRKREVLLMGSLPLEEEFAYSCSLDPHLRRQNVVLQGSAVQMFVLK